MPAKECSKHPGTLYTTIQSRPGKNGMRFSYEGCAKCKAEKDASGLPPVKKSAKPKRRAAQRATRRGQPELHSAKKKALGRQPPASEGFLSRLAMNLGIR